MPSKISWEDVMRNGLYFLYIFTAGIDSLFPPAGGIRYFPMLPLGDGNRHPTDTADETGAAPVGQNGSGVHRDFQ